MYCAVRQRQRCTSFPAETLSAGSPPALELSSLRQWHEPAPSADSWFQTLCHTCPIESVADNRRLPPWQYPSTASAPRDRVLLPGGTIVLLPWPRKNASGPRPD